MARCFNRTLAGMLLTVAGCSDGDQPALEPIRLLDRVAEIELLDGAMAGDFGGRRTTPLPVALRATAKGERPIVVSVARALGEGNDRRAAFVVAPGARLVWDGLGAGRRELRIGLAAVGQGAAIAGKARFRISARSAGGQLATLTELELDAAADGPWRDLRLPLPAAGIERLELALDAGSSAYGAWSAPELVAIGASDARPNVILISLDTLRADRLGSYGYGVRTTSPHLDRFAARAIRFETAVSQAPWTRPSHRAMLSGIYPASHGGLERWPIAAALWKAGYRTVALTAGGQIDARFGFDQGFESYAVDRHWLNEPERALAAVESAPGRAFFLFLHTYEIHDPYTDGRFLPPGSCPQLGGSFSKRSSSALKRKLSEEEKECVRALYDGDIAFADERIGRLLERLERSGLANDTIVIVTSDHGEQFWEHGGWRHGDHMYEHQIRVPLLVRLPESLRARFAAGAPGQSGAAVVTDPVALVDLAPSLYELLEVRDVRPMHGRSFVPLLAGERREPRELLSENTNISKVERKSIRTDRFKFIRAFSKVAGRAVPGPEFSLFELRRDPRELNNIAASHPEAVRALALRLEALTAGGLGDLDDETSSQLDADLRQELEALGYLGR